MLGKSRLRRKSMPVHMYLNFLIGARSRVLILGGILFNLTPGIFKPRIHIKYPNISVAIKTFYTFIEPGLETKTYQNKYIHKYTSTSQYIRLYFPTNAKPVGRYYPDFV